MGKLPGKRSTLEIGRSRYGVFLYRIAHLECHGSDALPVAVQKYKVIGTIAAVLQMYTFLGGGVHL